MSELLPCPFCGGEQTMRKHGGKVYLASTNHKRRCFMRELLPLVAFETEAYAAAAWNTRQPPRAFDSVETVQRVAELEAELADAKAEIRRLEAQGEYMAWQIAKAKEALR